MKQIIQKLIAKIRELKENDSVFFVGAADILPPPLPKEEEDYYLELKENGDENAKQNTIIDIEFSYATVKNLEKSFYFLGKLKSKSFFKKMPKLFSSFSFFRPTPLIEIIFSSKS